jgi:hypothetical protein
LIFTFSLILCAYFHFITPYIEFRSNMQLQKEFLEILPPGIH